MTTELILIRHGETAWNRSGRWQGLENIPLSPDGRRQARRLAERLAAQGPHLDHIYTSDLHRALETAQIVGQAIGLPVSPLLELREIDIGAWSGLSSSEIQARYPSEWRRIQAGEDLPRGGGETLHALRTRVSSALARLVADHPGQRLAVVTHGGVVRAALEVLLPDQLGAVPWIDNTALTTLAHTATGWRLVAANDNSHKDDPPAIDVMARDSL